MHIELLPLDIYTPSSKTSEAASLKFAVQSSNFSCASKAHDGLFQCRLGEMRLKTETGKDSVKPVKQAYSC